MNAKQKRFCDEYLVDGNATQAYSHGQRMLKNVEVKSYIDTQLEQLHSEKTADAQEILEYLTAVMRGECTEPDGSSAPARDRLKAAELLGKRHGIFTDKVSLDAQPIVLINDLPDDPPGESQKGGEEECFT